MIGLPRRSHPRPPIRARPLILPLESRDLPSPATLTAIGQATGRVQVRRASDSSVLFEFTPYGGYSGPVSVALGNVTGSGSPDLVTGAVAGNFPVKVYDGRAVADASFATAPESHVLAQWFPYGSNFNVGVNVAVGDVEANGFADVITGASAGNPDVRVYRGRDIATNTFSPMGFSLLAQWFPYALQFNIGANVAAGDVSHRGFADVVTGATGGNPDVRVYSGRDIALRGFRPDGASLLTQWFPYALQFNVGAFVAVGDVEGNGFPDVITGASVGNPQVKVYRGSAIANRTFNPATPDASLLNQFFAYALDMNIGVTVAAADVEGTGRFDVLTGPTRGTPLFRVLRVLPAGAPVPVFENLLSGTPGLTYVSGG